MAQASVIIEGDFLPTLRGRGADFLSRRQTQRCNGSSALTRHSRRALPQVARFLAQGPRQRNILSIISLFIAPTKTCPISAAMSKFREVASRARNSIAGEGSGI